MWRKKRTEIVVETSRLIIIGKTTAAWCDDCGAHVTMLTPEQAAAAAGTSARTVYRQAELGQLHFTETSTGSLLICHGSLRVLMSFKQS